MTLKPHSFASRLTRWITLTVLLTMTAVSLLILHLVTEAMMDETQARFHGIINIVDSKVESVLASVEVGADNNVNEIEKAVDGDVNLEKTLADALKYNPHIVGCGLAFVPDYYKEKGRWYEPYAARREGGDIDTSNIGSEYHDYFTKDWYVNAIKYNEGYWSDPYFDADGGRTMMCTYSQPIRNKKGTLVGVFGADVSLQWLTTQMRDIESKSNNDGWLKLNNLHDKLRTYSFILGRNGEYIVHPESKRVLADNFAKNARNTESKLDDQLARRMMRGESGYMTIEMDDVNSIVFYSPLKRTGWSMAIVVPRSLVLLPAFILSTMVMAVMLIGLVLVFVICRITVRHATKPLSMLALSADEVAKGNFDTSLPKIKYNDEIRRLRDSFEKMQTSLADYIEKLKESAAQKASYESELNIARDIQMSMLPKIFPPYPERKDVDLYGLLVPAKAVGGDLYDFNIRDEHLFFCVGDVSGKGVPAALVMAVISALFRSMSEKEDDPARIMKALNKSISTRNESLMFATLFVGNLDLKTGVLKYCNAGHTAPILASPIGVGYLACDSNLPIGVMQGVKYTLQVADVKPGTTIFLYTDGLSEAENEKYDLYGDGRIIEILRESVGQTPERIVSRMRSSVHEFTGNAEQNDDLTMLAVQYYVK